MLRWRGGRGGTRPLALPSMGASNAEAVRCVGWRACASTFGGSSKLSKSERQSMAESREGRRKFFEMLMKRHSVKRPEDWSRVSYKELMSAEGGREVMANYSGVLEALRDCFPEEQFLPFLCRSHVSAGHWDSRDNRREFCEYLKLKFSVKETCDWRKVSLDDVYAAGGKTLMIRFGSIHGLLEDTYPDLELPPHHCLRVLPKGYYDSMENCRALMDDIKEKLGIKEKGDWKNVQYRELRKLGAEPLLRKYRSTLALLQAVYPEEGFTWLDCRTSVPKEHWEERANRKAFMDIVKREFQVEKASDWRKVRREDLGTLGGGGLLLKFPSVFALLEDTYPEEKLEELECREHVSNSYWKSFANRRAFLDRLAAAHDVHEPSDWRRVSWQDVTALQGGNTFVALYDSMLDALRELYPEQEWEEIGCRPHARRGYWGTDEAIVCFLEMARAKYEIKEKEDWYRLSRKQIAALGGSSLLKRMSLCSALQLAYPEETWDEVKFAGKAKKSVQRILGLYVQRMYPGFTMHEEYRHEALGSMELDIFLPDLNLALEYNGEHHYSTIPVFGAVEQYRRRDREKAAKCRASGIKLIIVPYWWDNELASLAATIAEEDQSLLNAAEAAVSQRGREAAEPTASSVLSILSSVRAGEVSPIERFNDCPEASVEQKLSQGSRITALADITLDSLADPTGAFFCVDEGETRVRSTGGELATLAAGKLVDAPAQWTAQLPREVEVEGKLLNARHRENHDAQR